MDQFLDQNAKKQAQQRYRREYDAAHREHINQRSAAYRALHKDKLRQELLAWSAKNPLRVLLKNASRRAKVRQVPFTLTEGELETLWTPQCPVLGLTYDLSLEGPLDLSPSLDRLDPQGPYSLGNVAIMTYRANRLKNNGTADEHRAIGERMRDRPLLEKTPLTPEQRRECELIFQYRGSRARRRSVDFRLSADDIPGFPSHCPYLGIPLVRNLGRPKDDSRSLDRIDSGLGYVPGNVELVSARANRLKGDGSAEEHLRLAAWIERQAEH